MNPSSEFSIYSDATLIELIEACDLAALEALYDRYAVAVYGLVINITHEASVAEAVLHEIFWQIWCQPSTLQAEANVLAYFCRVARRTSLQQLRRCHGKAQPQLEIV